MSTAPKQGLDPLDVLRRLFEGTPWLPVSAPVEQSFPWRFLKHRSAVLNP
jgi:hypothetical protein